MYSDTWPHFVRYAVERTSEGLLGQGRLQLEDVRRGGEGNQKWLVQVNSDDGIVVQDDIGGFHRTSTMGQPGLIYVPTLTLAAATRIPGRGGGHANVPGGTGLG